MNTTERICKSTLDNGCDDDACPYMPCGYCIGFGCKSCGHTGHALDDESGEPMPSGIDDVDLSALSDALQARGIAARVDMTGGGVATLFAGPTHLDAEGDERSAVMVGPGSFHTMTASTCDLYVGPDDDSGEAITISTGASLADIVAVVVEAVAARTSEEV